MYQNLDFSSMEIMPIYERQRSEQKDSEEDAEKHDQIFNITVDKQAQRPNSSIQNIPSLPRQISHMVIQDNKQLANTFKDSEI